MKQTETFFKLLLKFRGARSEPSPDVTLSDLRLHGTDHQRLGLSRHSLGRPCLRNSPPRDRAVPQFRHSSGGAASEHTQLPEKVPSCPPRARKDRPLSKATSGPQIFPDPPLALKQSGPVKSNRLHLLHFHLRHHHHHLHYHQHLFLCCML